MSSFEDRGKSFENKYAHDQEFEFKVNARRNKLLGLWAAGCMHYDEAKSASYAASVVEKGIDGGQSDEAVIEKISADFNGAGLEVDVKEIEKQISDFSAQARQELNTEE